MANKKLRRIKRIISSYLLRIGIVLMLLLMITLMVCGCLYIYEHLIKNDTLRVNADTVQNNDNGSTITALETDKASKFCVVLDAGHGGNDIGTSRGDIVEKDINLSIVLKVKTFLEESNIEVMLTRNSDEYVSLDQRVTVANNSNAHVFISIHCNYYEDDDSIAGMECYYSSPDASESKEYAESIINAVALSNDIITREAKVEDYYILRNATMPAVLVEMGFLSNYYECQKLLSEDYQDRLAQKISEGILHELNGN